MKEACLKFTFPIIKGSRDMKKPTRGRHRSNKKIWERLTKKKQEVVRRVVSGKEREIRVEPADVRDPNQI